MIRIIHKNVVKNFLWYALYIICVKQNVEEDEISEWDGKQNVWEGKKQKIEWKSEKSLKMEKVSLEIGSSWKELVNDGTPNP